MVRIVPWTSFEEFETVQKWLYSQTPEEAQWGVDRVAAWISRGCVPVAVECTATLIQLRLRDRGHTILSQRELRHLYSIALIRLVNGMVDIEQQGNLVRATSVVAAQLGLPLWFVDIRHAATHEHLPGLSVLRDAAEQALQWLYDFYWALELKPEKSPMLDDTKVLSIRVALKQYKDARKAFIKDLKRGRPTSNDHEGALKRFMKAVSGPYIRDAVVPELLKPGGLVPVSKKKRPSLDYMVLSKDLLDLWTPILRELDRAYSDFGKELIDAIVKRLDVKEEYKINNELSYLVSEPLNNATDDDLTGNSYLLTLSCYLKHIVSNDFGNDDNSEPILRSIELNDVMEGCLRHPNHFTRVVLRNISHVGDDDLERELEPFLKYIDSYLANKHSTESTADTSQEVDMEGELNELKERVQAMQGVILDDDEDRMDIDEVSKGWALYDSSKWSACPLGCLPNGEVPCLDLDVFE
ncbi:Las1-domain-containing protein [Lichtheimia hyalospora FSU 10163]|nr:Las1-domain-containing protein [Lichtheimia hyalospora FSU 10163]